MAMITCPECGKQVSELAESCPNCGFPMGFVGGKTGKNNNQQNQHQQNNTYQQNAEAQPIKAYVHEPDKNSGLGIAALIFSIFGVTFFIGIILAVIDLCRKDGRKKVLSIVSLIVCAFWIILAISVGGDSDGKKDENRTESQNVTQDEEGSFDESKQKKEEQKKKDFADSEEYTEVTSTELINSYNDNQVKCKQTYDGKMLKVSGKVQSVGTDIMGDTYVCLGHDTEFTFVGVQCYAKDDDTINQIAELKEGEEITVCGKGECGSLSFSLKDTKIIDVQENSENNENDYAKKNGGDFEKSEERHIYTDENVVILYNGMSGNEKEYRFNYTIENLTDKTLIVQVRETSINGYMVDPMCSIEIAPGKKAQDGMIIWSDDAKKYPMDTVENVETKFHIFNDDGWVESYDTESIVIIE